MPSRPMFTTPARSDHNPPRPARPIGTAHCSASRTWPLDVRSSAPVITRTTDTSTNAPEMISSTTGRLTRRLPGGGGVATGVLRPGVVDTLTGTPRFARRPRSRHTLLDRLARSARSRLLSSLEGGLRLVGGQLVADPALLGAAADPVDDLV